MEQNKFRRHIYQIAAQHNIKVVENPDVITSPGGGYAITTHRLSVIYQVLSVKAYGENHGVIVVEPIDGDKAYASALHECGHILEPDGYLIHGDRNTVNTVEGRELIVREEVAAWNWAFTNAIEWTPAMENWRALSLKTYYDGLTELRLKEQYERSVERYTSPYMRGELVNSIKWP